MPLDTTGGHIILHQIFNDSVIKMQKNVNNKLERKSKMYSELAQRLKKLVLFISRKIKNVYAKATAYPLLSIFTYITHYKLLSQSHFNPLPFFPILSNSLKLAHPLEQVFISYLIESHYKTIPRALDCKLGNFPILFPLSSFLLLSQSPRPRDSTS